VHEELDARGVGVGDGVRSRRKPRTRMKACGLLVGLEMTPQRAGVSVMAQISAEEVLAAIVRAN